MDTISDYQVRTVLTNSDDPDSAIIHLAKPDDERNILLIGLDMVGHMAGVAGIRQSVQNIPFSELSEENQTAVRKAVGDALNG